MIGFHPHWFCWGWRSVWCICCPRQCSRAVQYRVVICAKQNGKPTTQEQSTSTPQFNTRETHHTFHQARSVNKGRRKPHGMVTSVYHSTLMIDTTPRLSPLVAATDVTQLVLVQGPPLCPGRLCQCRGTGIGEWCVVWVDHQSHWCAVH